MSTFEPTTTISTRQTDLQPTQDNGTEPPVITSDASTTQNAEIFMATTVTDAEPIQQQGN